MTRELYLDMHKSMGTEPLEKDIPISLSDLPYLVQQSLQVYSLLPSDFDSNSGLYLGKNLTILPFLFDLYDVEDKKQSLDVIIIADQINKEIVNKKNIIKINKAMSNGTNNN